VSGSDQQIAGVVLPGTRQSQLGRVAASNHSAAHFLLVINHSRDLSQLKIAVGTALAT
jgi:hypothetical protein